MSALQSEMKTHNQLYGEICAFENLLLAARRVERCKRFSPLRGGERIRKIHRGW